MGDNTLDNLSKEYSLYRLPNEVDEVKTETKQLPELKQTANKFKLLRDFERVQRKRAEMSVAQQTLSIANAKIKGTVTSQLELKDQQLGAVPRTEISFDSDQYKKSEGEIDLSREEEK